LLGTQTRRFQIAFEHKERCTKKCMSYLRIAYATLDEFVPITNLQSVEKIDPISIRNECAVLQVVAQAAVETLKTFNTSLEEDIKLLEDPDKKLTMNQRNCLIMRKGEKEILHAYIELAQHVKEVETFGVRNLKKYMDKSITGKGKKPSIAWRMEMFFEEIWIPLLTGVKKELEEMNNSLEDSD